MSTNKATPYGQCRCGCGGKTRIAPKTSTARGWKRGEPQPYLSGHGTKGRSKHKPTLCECGCGELVTPGSRFRHGHSARVRTAADPIALFWDKVDKTPGHGPAGECWIWTASLNDQGYGWFWDARHRRMTPAHRWAYDTFVAPLAEKPAGTLGAVGEVVCHRCDNPRCVRPDHLFLGTQDDNMADMIAKGRAPSNAGARNPRARLTEEQAKEARRRFGGSPGQIAALAREYGVSHGAMSAVVHGRTWR